MVSVEPFLYKIYRRSVMISSLGLNSFSVLIFFSLYSVKLIQHATLKFSDTISGALLSVRRLNRGGNNQLWHVWNPWRTFCTRLDSRGELRYCGLWFQPLWLMLSNIVQFFQCIFLQVFLYQINTFFHQLTQNMTNKFSL